LATTPDEVERIVATGRLAIDIGVENGYAIARDVARIAEYRALGAAYISLTHSAHNDLADSSQPRPALGDPPVLHGGLSDLGREAVAAMNRAGVLVDVSHASDAATQEATRLSRAPVIASHSAVRALNAHPRNLSDELLREVAATD